MNGPTFGQMDQVIVLDLLNNPMMSCLRLILG